MNENQKELLAEKKKHLQIQLQAKEYIRRGITYHWLNYFSEIQNLGMEYHIEFLCMVTAEEQPYYTEALKDLKNPELKPEMVQVIAENPVDRILKKYPSTSHFKYVINLPLLSECDSDVSKMLRAAQDTLRIEAGPVFFFSSDCSPLLVLQWPELVEHANQIFDDNHISLIFTDPNTNWVIFRSIEEEWRCGFTGKNYDQ